MADGTVKIELELETSKADSQAAKAGKKLGDEIANNLGKGTDKAKDSLDDMADKADEAFDDVSKSASDSGDKVEGVFGTKIPAATAIAVAAIGAIVLKLIDVAGNAVSVGSEFDKAMSQVAATMGVASSEVQELRDFAKEMGETTAFSATQAAESLNFLALAGYDAQTSMEMLPTVLNLAAAGNIELAAASDMVTDAQSALGLSLEETTVMVDQMAQTSSKTNTSVAQLGEAFLTVGGTARNLAGGTAELSQMLGILADNGIKGAEGGTALRNVILSLSAPTDKAAGIMDNFGIKVFDAAGKMRPMPEIFADINEAMEPLTQQERTEVLNNIFNKVDLKSANALLGTSAERFDEVATAIDNAAGSAQKMADTQLDNLAGDVTLLQSATEGLYIAISDKLSPILRGLTQFATNTIMPALTGLVKNLDVFAPMLGSIAVAIGIMVGKAPAMAALTKAFDSLKVSVAGSTKAFNAMTTSQKAAAVATKGLSVAMKALKSVGIMLAISAAVEVVTMLAQAFMDAKERSDKFKQATDGLVSSSESYRKAFNGARSAVEDATVSVDSYASKSKDLTKTLDSVIDKQAELADSISNTWNDVGVNNATVQNYADTIDKLTNKYDKYGNKLELTASEQAELIAAVDGINSIMGTSYSVIDAQNGVLDTNTDRILASARAWQERAIAEAASQMNVELTKQKVEAHNALIEADEVLAQAEKEYNDAVAAGVTDLRMQEDAIADANAKKQEAEKLESDLNKEIERTNKTVAEMNESLKHSVDALSEFVDQNEAWSKALNDAGVNADDFITKMSNMGVSVDDLAKIMQEKGVEGIDGFVKAYQGGVDELADWMSDNGIRIPDELAEAIRSGKPNVEAASDETADAVEQEISDVDGQGIGEEIVDEYADAIADGADDAGQASEQVKNAAENPLKNADSATWGEHLVNNFANGMIGKALDGVRAAANKVMGAIAGIMKFTVPKRGIFAGQEHGGKLSGQHLIENFADGMESSEAVLVKAAEKGLKAVRNTFGEAGISIADEFEKNLGSVNPLGQVEASMKRGVSLNTFVKGMDSQPASYTTTNNSVQNVYFQQDIKYPAEVTRAMRLENLYD